MKFNMSTTCGFEPAVSVPNELILKLEAEIQEGCDESVGAVPKLDARRSVSIGRVPSLRTLKLRRAARGAAVPPEVPEEVQAEVIPEVVPEVVPDTVQEAVQEVVPEAVPEVVPEVIPKTVPDYVPEVVPEGMPEVVPKVEREVIHQVTEELIQQQGTVEGNDCNENVGEHKLGGRTVKQEHSEVRTQGARVHPFSPTTGTVFRSVVLAGAASLGLRRRHRSKAASTPPMRFVGTLKEVQGTCNPPPTQDENNEPCMMKKAQSGVKQGWHDEFKGFVPRPPTVPRDKHQFKRQIELMGSTFGS